MMSLLPVIAALLSLALPSASPAAPDVYVIQGEVITLESMRDEAAMSSMVLGDTVDWEVAVSANREDGMLDVGLDIDAERGEFAVSLHVCAVPWRDGLCDSGGVTVLSKASMAGTYLVGSQMCSTKRWYLVQVERLGADVSAATIRLQVDGHGDSVSADGLASSLPQTGHLAAPALWPAFAAIAGGLVIAGAARTWRRRCVESSPIDAQRSL